MHDILLFIQNHMALAVALVAVVILLVIIEFIRSRAMAAVITLGRATLMINHDSAVVVDIRSSDLFQAGHIVDAISLPAKTIDTHYTKLNKYKAQPIIICCAHGTESNRIAELLMKHQFTVYILKGGLRSWKEASMPLVKG